MNIRTNDTDDLTGEMFVDDADGYTEREREIFDLGFEFCDIIHSICGEYNFDGPVRAENVARIKDTMTNLGLNYSLEPITVDDETVWLLKLLYCD